MYEHPIKRAGLSMNRIVYSNTKIVMQGFPKANPQQFNLAFKHKTFENGKAIKISSKSQTLSCAATDIHRLLTPFFPLVYTSDDLDEVLPCKHKV